MAPRGNHRQMLSIRPDNEPRRSDENLVDAESREPVSAPDAESHSSSRWVDYDTHELLDMIGELEDERRWARFREGVLWAVLFHIVLISSLTWIPRYVFKVPPVIDPFDAIKQRKDLTYLDLPPDALKQLQPHKIKPLTQKSLIDKQTMEEMKKTAPPPTPQPTPSQQQPQQAAPAPIPPAAQAQSQMEAPRPQAVPAKPSFSMNSMNQSEMMRESMHGSSHAPGYGAGNSHGSGMPMHPGAGTGGVQVLSDTQGVDFSGWLQRWHRETARTWDPLIPDEVNAPIYKSGMVAVRFKVAPNGRVIDGSMVLEGRSGDVALDRAAWGAITGSNYPPLPHDFHGPYLELRAYFLYNMREP